MPTSSLGGLEGGIVGQGNLNDSFCVQGLGDQLGDGDFQFVVGHAPMGLMDGFGCNDLGQVVQTAFGPIWW